MPHLPGAERALGRQLRLVTLEVALYVPADETECDPVAECLASFLLNPVAFRLVRSCHDLNVPIATAVRDSVGCPAEWLQCKP
jgi:hypothetical protein